MINWIIKNFKQFKEIVINSYGNVLLADESILIINKNKTVLEKRASLLKMDSVHGDFNGTVEIDENNKALMEL